MNRSLAWGLAALLLAAAVFPFRAVVISAAVLVVVAIALSLVAAWVSRPSAYESARRLDDVAGLRDRISTAWHCAAIEAPNAMILCQRRDALERVAQTDPRVSFPLRIPAAVGRTLVLAVAVAGFVTYLSTHKPPLAAVAERVTPTVLKRAVQLLRRPDAEQLVRERAARADDLEADASELNLENGLHANINRARDRKSGGKAASPLTDPSQSGEDPDPGEDGEQDASGQSEQTPRSAEALQKGAAGSELRTDAPREGKAPGASAGSSPASGEAAPSLAQRIQQALKDLLAKAVGDQPKGPDGRGSGDKPTEPAPNVRKLPAPTSDPSARSSQAPGESDAQPGTSGATLGTNEAGQGDAPNGKRSGPGSMEMAENAALETHPKQDVVPLSPTRFKGQATMLTSNQRGTALVPFRDTAPRSSASTKGAEQADVPLRYRTYVQKYFSHPDEVRR